MKVIDTIIEGVKVIEPDVHKDQRGLFLETFQAQRYNNLLNLELVFVQDTFSRSIYKVLRGLHFQQNKPQGKLIQVVRGKIFDVAVDIRKNSSTFGKWFSQILSGDNHKQIWIPRGLAHGFLVLSSFADVEYKFDEYYFPEDERCLIWNDLEVNIDWPLSSPKLSDKDLKGKKLRELV